MRIQKKMAFCATKNIAIFANFCQNRGFWPISRSDYTIFRALRDLIFDQHTPTYTLSKMEEKEQIKIFILPEISEFADFHQNWGFWPNSTSDYTIFRALRDLIFYQHTPTYTLSKMGEKEQTKIFIWPLRGRQKYPKILEFSPQIFLSPGFFQK